MARKTPDARAARKSNIEDAITWEGLMIPDKSGWGLYLVVGAPGLSTPYSVSK